MFSTILLIKCLEAKTDLANGNKKCFQDRNNDSETNDETTDNATIVIIDSDEEDEGDDADDEGNVDGDDEYQKTKFKRHKKQLHGNTK